MLKSWFYQQSIATKMFISVAFVMVFAIVMGSFSIYQISTFIDLLQQYATKYNIPNEIVAKEISQFETLRNLIAGMLVLGVIVCYYVAHFTIKNVICKSLWYAQQALERIADGDLTQNINVKSNEEIGMLFAAMKRIIEKLREVSSDINRLTHTLAENSNSLLQTTQEMNHNAHEQAHQTSR